MLRRLPPEELADALRSKLVPVISLPGLTLYAACGPAAQAEGERLGLRIVGTADAHDLLAAARGVHGPALLAEATYRLARRMPEFSARRRLTDGQASVLLALAVLAGAAAVLLPLELAWLIASLMGGLFFLSIVALRFLCLMPPLQRPAPPPPPLADEDLPCYSVLVPLFRETSVLEQLVRGLGALRYPALGSKRTNKNSEKNNEKLQT